MRPLIVDSWGRYAPSNRLLEWFLHSARLTEVESRWLTNLVRVNWYVGNGEVFPFSDNIPLEVRAIHTRVEQRGFLIYTEPETLHVDWFVTVGFITHNVTFGRLTTQK